MQARCNDCHDSLLPYHVVRLLTQINLHSRGLYIQTRLLVRCEPKHVQHETKRKTFCRIILAHTTNTFEKLSFVMLTSWLFLVKNTHVPFRGYSVPLVMNSLGLDALALL